MSKSMRRARRRRDVARMVAKARMVYPEADCPRKLANNLKIRSCALCGNPRRYWLEETKATRIADINWLEWSRDA